MVQEDKTLDIVWNKTLVDGSISSKSKVPLKNGVHVASVIPARFFSYESSSTAQVSGVVFLKLAEAEGRRRLAIGLMILLHMHMIICYYWSSCVAKCCWCWRAGICICYGSSAREE